MRGISEKTLFLRPFCRSIVVRQFLRKADGRVKFKVVNMRQSQGGFSLVELMCVVAIVAILASFAITGFWTFLVKARQAESRANTRLAFVLYESYLSNSELRLLGHYDLTGPDLSNGTSCIIANPLGFAIKGCNKSHYAYRYSGFWTSPAIDGRLVFSATELGVGGGGTAVLCAAQIFLTGSRGGLYCIASANTRKVFPGCNVPGSVDAYILEQDGQLFMVNNSLEFCMN